MPKKLTQAEFLAKAVAVHGVGRYDYSQVVYLRGDSKVLIKCLAHGVFSQTPNNHTNGYGCPKCGSAKALATSQSKSIVAANNFITKAQSVHGIDTYDYSRVIYSRAAIKVSIICPIHGEFRQGASKHIQGAGCPKCKAKQAARGRVRIDFLLRANAVHGLGKYDYSKSDYTKAGSKLIIICKVHGEFEQIALSHLRGMGCFKCAHERLAENSRMTTKQFIEKAQLVHGLGKFDYSQVVYAGQRPKVKIGCLIHGVFLQSPRTHTNGAAGCPACASQKSWIEKSSGRDGILYFVKIYSSVETFYKIGVTFMSVEKRFKGKALRSYKYELLAVYKSKNAVAVYDWEQSIIETFAHLRYKPKNYFGGNTECFSSADEILAVFPL